MKTITQIKCLKHGIGVPGAECEIVVLVDYDRTMLRKDGSIVFSYASPPITTLKQLIKSIELAEKDVDVDEIEYYASCYDCDYDTDVEYTFSDGTTTRNSKVAFDVLVENMNE